VSGLSRIGVSIINKYSQCFQRADSELSPESSLLYSIKIIWYNAGRQFRRIGTLLKDEG